MLHHAGSFLALEAALLRELRAVRAGEPLAPVVVLVPTNLLRRHLGAEAARRGGCLNIHFLTLLDLAREVGEPALAAAGRAELPPLAGELIARAVCRARPDTYFAAIAQRAGFHRALLATIEDLKQAGHTPADLEKCLEHRAWRGHPARRKLADLAALWAACEERFAALHLRDAADLMAAGAAAAGGDRWLAQAAAVLVYGFYDLNELQRRLVAACTAGRRAAAFVPHVPGSAAFAYGQPTFEWLVAQGFAPQAEPEPDLSPGLAALGRHLFAEPPEAAAQGDHVRIVSAPDEAREVQAIVRAAVAAAGQSTPLPRIGVLLRHTSTYAPLFAEECAAGGLDAYHHDPPPLSTTRAGRSFLMLLRLVGSEFPRPEVMDFLTYADLALEPEPPTADWDLLSIQAGVVKGRDAWHRRLAALRQGLQEPREEDDHPQRTAELLGALDSLAAFLGDFLPALEGVPNRGTWPAMVSAVLGLFRRFVRASEEREAVAEAVADLSALDAAGEPADAATLARLAREVLEGRHPRRPTFGSRGPVVVDLMEGRGLPFDLVCVPGLAEKGFPALPSPDPLLSDGERAGLSRAGLRLPLKRRRAEEERLLFRLATGAAAEAVLLTHPRLEADSGRERVPSHFLLRAVEAVTGKRCSYATLEEFERPWRIGASAFAPSEPEAAWREAEYDLATAYRGVATARRGAKGGTPLAEVGFLAALSPTFAAALRAEASRWGERVFTPYDGVLRAEAALAALREELGPPPWRMPPTALEGYAACPFRYFLRHVLGVEPLEEPEAVRRLSGMDRGRLFHRILHRALRRARDAGQLPLRADAEEQVLQVAREGFAKFEELGLVGLPALWSLERGAIELDLRRFVLAEAADTSPYIPAHFEACFGTRREREEEEPWSEEGLVLDLGQAGRVRVVGRIDRIDLTADRTRGRVVDYKTGRKSGRSSSLAGGTALQLPLYLKAAELLIPGATMDAACYRYVTERGEYAEVAFSRDAYGARESELRAVLATIVAGICQGRFFAGMPDSGDCDRCDYQCVCGRAAEAAARRKKAEPAVQAYTEMREVQ